MASKALREVGLCGAFYGVVLLCLCLGVQSIAFIGNVEDEDASYGNQSQNHDCG
jgi:hypothetical protein